MTPNDDRRDQDDTTNPFILFRHFADRQFSSVIASIANLAFNVDDLTPEHINKNFKECIESGNQPTTCSQIRALEETLAKVNAQGRESYARRDMAGIQKRFAEASDLLEEIGEKRCRLREGRNGTLQSDNHMQDYQAEHMRKEQLKRGLGTAKQELMDLSPAGSGHEETRGTVEQKGAEKGEQWASEWDWDLFRPWGKEGGDNTEGRAWSRSRWCRRGGNHDREAVQAFERRPASIADFAWSQIAQTLDEMAPFSDDFVDVFVRPVLPTQHPCSPYSPSALEADSRLQNAGISWRDAYEDLLRASQGKPLLEDKVLGQSSSMPYQQWIRRLQQQPFPERPTTLEGYPKPVPWTDESSTSEEPDYEYGHDHEDQHDDPPPSKAADGPATEIEAYERFLGSTSASTSTSMAQKSSSSDRPSVLSTLTTTERTVQPDGTVTTKVVLKKRFADGREESSETVQTQRGHEDDTKDVWREMREAQFGGSFGTDEGKGKKSGWFWSG
ncbi:hypothetical protein GQ43DRAFT_437932 [Delitschia confertaspora ATCC 74209]|uniref:Uncharacterized protein n=1 Tax=Delitschia confertaspora ATCC 74209 TaxID=1513339 RepID=A0A9P4JU26_9PLEO|nr:hypothetical protein GQ43DRAFT_437932 [Delitschia confertaspora ATCC 74209]